MSLQAAEKLWFWVAQRFQRCGICSRIMKALAAEVTESSFSPACFGVPHCVTDPPPLGAEFRHSSISVAPFMGGCPKSSDVGWCSGVRVRAAADSMRMTKSAAQRRKNAAHGASRGAEVGKSPSPGGAKEHLVPGDLRTYPSATKMLESCSLYTCRKAL